MKQIIEVQLVETTSGGIVFLVKEDADGRRGHIVKVAGFADCGEFAAELALFLDVKLVTVLL